MKPLTSVVVTTFTAIALGTSLVACGGQKLEACRIIEIEDAEAEVKIGDIDIEGGEVEMLCDETLVDVPWGQFRKKLRLDPGQFKTNLRAFEDQVLCMKDERSNKKEVFCKGPNDSQYQRLKFNYDD